MPYVIGFLGLAVSWLVIGLFSGFWNPMKLFEGVDKRPSTSKFQFLLWTAAVIFGYLAVYAAKDGGGVHHFEPLTNLPANLLAAMGISAATAVAAKAVTTTNLANGKQKTAFDPTAAAAAPAGPDPAAPETISGGVFQSDDGTPDLGKIQMIIWTLIAIGVFLSGVISNVSSPNPNRTLPDIGQPLMILMGLGHAAYVGKKIAE